MILQALNDYYERLREDPESGVPEFGFVNDTIDSIVDLDESGVPLSVTPLDAEKITNCPAPAVSLSELNKEKFPLKYKRTSGVAAYFMTDKGEYTLNSDNNKKNIEFRTLSRMVLGDVEDQGLQAFVKFVRCPEHGSRLLDFDADFLKRRKVAFRYKNELTFLHEKEEAINKWLNFMAGIPGKSQGKNLIDNTQAYLLPVHPPIRNRGGVFKSDKGEMSLVSFNFDAAVSYGKTQNFNAPVSERAAFAYTTALNHLLAPGSERKVQVGDTTVVFWTEAPSGDAVPMFGFALGGGRTKDTGLTQRLEGHIRAIARGRMPEELGDPKTRFYVLGLSPNAARISVRFWHVGTVGDMAENLGAHYRALALKPRFDSDPEHPGPWWLLKELAPQRDSRNMSPLLAGQFMKAVIKNHPYPRSLLTAALGRIRADKTVNYLRAAIIKAYLTRNEKQEIHMVLDKENSDIGYRLGRLFAFVERIQEEAIPGANATVRDRFFGAASATPGRAFPIILRNAQNGLAKIRKGKPGYAVNLEKAIQSIVGGIDSTKGFPSNLSLEEQGMFILGYYQQRQDQFTKKEDKTEE